VLSIFRTDYKISHSILINFKGTNFFICSMLFKSDIRDAFLSVVLVAGLNYLKSKDACELVGALSLYKLPRVLVLSGKVLGLT
jgi:hypothetical protein